MTEFLIASGSSVFAQERTLPAFFALSTKERVYIILGEVPEGTEGFYLYRKGPKDKEFVRLTKEPIKPTRDPILFRSMIGEDWDWVKKATRGETEFQVLRRILRDKGLQVAFSFVSLKVAKGLGRLYVDEDVEFGERYTYKVVFVNILDKEVGSCQKGVVVKEARIPEPPFDVKAHPGDSQIKVEWKYHKLAEKFEYTAVGFNIYRKQEEEKEFKKINKVLILWQEDMTYRVDFDVKNNKRYTYYVTAVDLIGIESSPSNYSEAVPVDKTPPAMPEGIAAKGLDDRIVIGWRMNLELDLSHYNLYRGRNLQDEFKKINKEPIPGDIPYYEDEDIIPGKPYFYKVQAVDKSGNLSRLTSAISGLVKDETPPDAPTSLKAKVSEHKVTLDWGQKTTPDLMGFYIYRGRTKEDFMRIVKLPVKDKNFQDEGYQNKGLVPGMTYFYGVSTVDTSYNESKRIWIRVDIPDDEPPATPVSIYARPTKNGKVEVRWQAAHSWDVSGYRVYRGKDEEKSKLLIETGESTFSYIDREVKKGGKYYYYVVAIDKAKNESKPTPKFYVTPTDITSPPVPANIKTVYKKKKGVYLSWERVKVEDLAGYRVYRAHIPSGVYELLNPEELIKKTNFLDKEGKKNLYYKVTSVDTSLNESKSPEPIRATEEEE